MRNPGYWSAQHIPDEVEYLGEISMYGSVIDKIPGLSANDDLEIIIQTCEIDGIDFKYVESNGEEKYRSLNDSHKQITSWKDKLGRERTSTSHFEIDPMMSKSNPKEYDQSDLSEFNPDEGEIEEKHRIKLEDGEMLQETARRSSGKGTVYLPHYGNNTVLTEYGSEIAEEMYNSGSLETLFSKLGIGSRNKTDELMKTERFHDEDLVRVYPEFHGINWKPAYSFNGQEINEYVDGSFSDSAFDFEQFLTDPIL